MRIQAYTRYAGIVTVTAATVRPEAAASTIFTAATVHEDFAASVRALLEEHIHVMPTQALFGSALQLQTYFPVNTASQPIYALKELMPAGAPRAIDAQFMLEITALRYAFVLDLLPAAFTVSATKRSAIERAMEYAIKSLFVANGVPDTYIPGDNDIRPDNPQSGTGQTDIDIVCQLGQASLRTGVDLFV